MWMSYDLLSGLLPFGAYLAALAVVVMIVTWWARRHHSETAALTATRSIAGMFLGLIIVGVLFGGVNTFARSRLVLGGQLVEWMTTHQTSLLSPTCEIDGEISRPEASTGASPITYCNGGVEQVPLAPRMMIFVGSLLILLAAATIAWSIYTAALLASMREPFHPSVPRTFRLAAIVVIVAAVIGNVFTTIGMTLAARSLNWATDVTVPYVFEFPVWPFAVALGLVALSAIFQYGERLQRETEGLV